MPDLLENFLSRALNPGAVPHSDRVKQNIRRLYQPGSLAVTASIYPDLFGGSLSQYLKCLTAVQISQALSERAIDAVPVCWIRFRHRENAPGNNTVHILDPRRDLHNLQKRPAIPETDLPGREKNYSDSLSLLIEEIGRLGGESFNTKILDLLRDAYCRDLPGSSALARLLARLMETWGIVVLDSGCFPDEAQSPFMPDVGIGRTLPPVSEDYWMQFMTFPLQLSVLSPCDLDAFSETCAVFREQGGQAPFAWPSISATLVDKDSRRTMRKFDLRLPDLFAGGEHLIENLHRELPLTLAAEKLNALNSEFERRINAMAAGSTGNGSIEPQKNECLKRIDFQLNKIMGRFETAVRQKLEVMQRRIPRLCNSLVPGGEVQECGLSGIYFLLLYSQDLFSQLYKNLDFETREHQVIDVY
ncbi:MAG: bacillithiol biosynthesis BshC [Acidobacteriota bacterium]